MFVEVYLGQAVKHVACYAVFHTCQFWNKKSALEEHHLERVKLHHQIDKKTKKNQEILKNGGNDVESQQNLNGHTMVEETKSASSPHQTRRRSGIKQSELRRIASSANSVSKGKRKLQHPADMNERLYVEN